MAKIVVCDKKSCAKVLPEGAPFIEIVVTRRLNKKEILQLCEESGKEFDEWVNQQPK